MISNTLKTYQEDEIPVEPGLYSFHLNMITMDKVGLIGNSNFNKEKLQVAKINLLNRLDRIDKILNSRLFSGKLVEKEKNYYNSVSYGLSATSNHGLIMDQLKLKIEAAEDIVRVVKLLNRMCIILPPLYVGITINQTLKKRYNQHKSNFFKNKNGSFGGRIAEANIRWDELIFSAVEIPTRLIDKEMLELCEDILHGLSKPIYSIS